ncbi:hypothetical protein P3X46_005453 [Hevea brasiliensis]|uniref:ChrR-like cupin domain-containing protein n=1 Tax=Hevea brasiliensis TaxID=3981 RepID=A0ABQ9N2M3_HEVBR|nr:DNA damage-repair/toleration protein DRT102 [Hevea brasiliensis]KAJ9185871.1 hypothetical protein P3X46_005453 [Hevea brasiliensis]
MAESDVASTPRPLKIITGADSFGCNLKDDLVSHLRSLNIDVEDLGTSSYYSVAAEVGRRVSTANATSPSSPSPEIRGLVACGTGVGVSIFANKFPGVFATTCLSKADAINTRSINNCNVLAVSGMSTSPESAIEILDTWLNTPFKAPCPAFNFAPWSEEISSFLDNSLEEMPKVGKEDISNENKEETLTPCALCCLVKNRKLDPIDIIPGGSMKIVRESPTSAIVSFKAGSVEPAHHHTFGHDLLVMKGSKRVWNLTKKTKYDLGVGDYLFTPAGDVHRVKYFEDTEFFIKWEGQWDMFFGEDLEVAKSAIEKEAEDGFKWIK